ncbi:MAG TPA: methyl-galactoside ABC transporter substrate-binding protein, partial [Spirochaetaceae bacterium]|nr:methyl-galactoside ABC transporter substrate-binding protein [Spirochaetaceae bacterium]
MNRKIGIIALAILIALSVASVSATGSKESGQIVIGANIYSFADNFMNGVMKPELERYAAGKGAKIEIVDSEGQQAKLNDQVDVFISKKVSVLAINLVDPASAKAIIAKA